MATRQENARAIMGRNLRVYHAQAKMKAYNDSLPPEERRKALKNGTWSQEQLEALRRAKVDAPRS